MKKETDFSDRLGYWFESILLTTWVIILALLTFLFGSWLTIKGIKFIMFELGL